MRQVRILALGLLALAAGVLLASWPDAHATSAGDGLGNACDRNATGDVSITCDVALGSASPSSADTPVPVTIGSDSVLPGESTTVSLQALGLSQSLGAATVDVIYNPAVVSITDCSADPSAVFDLVSCNPTFGPDTIRFVGISASGVSGDVSLAELTFRAIGSPGEESALNVTVQTFADTDGLDIPVTGQDGSIGILMPPVACAGLAVTIVGTENDDLIPGTPGPDVIHGLAGRDTINGFGGEDVICGGRGDDILRGGRRNDILKGDRGWDTLIGDRGWDMILAGSGQDVSYGKSGNDKLYGEEDNDRLYGGEHNDMLKGGTGNDVLDGGVGTDACYGGPGADTKLKCEA